MDRTLTSRFEMKYLVYPHQVNPIRRFIGPFMEPDPYSAKKTDLRYPICSLYLDTPDVKLYNQTMTGEKNRFKLRVRCYSDHPGDPVFFEVKRKVDQTVLKSRAMMNRNEFNRVVSEGTMPELIEGTVREQGFAEFRQLTAACDLRPVVRVRYRREAYESRAGDPVRITFDHDLGHLLTHDWELRHHAMGWRDTHTDGVIFEVKFTDRFPHWIEEMVRVFELQRLSVPKYCLAIEESIAEGRYDAFYAAGLPQVNPRVQT